MEIKGFTVILDEYCEFCPEFECVLDSMDCTGLDGSKKMLHNISCKYLERCRRIVDFLKK